MPCMCLVPGSGWSLVSITCAVQVGRLATHINLRYSEVSVDLPRIIIGPAATKMPGRPDAPITARRHRAVGYVYACTSFAKGMTALLLSIYSHSLGYSRPFLAMFAVWDMLTLFVATNHAIRRRFRAHRCWMIRNFSAGAGSIWVIVQIVMQIIIIYSCKIAT
eukprot:SAG31_NODE_1789_length_7236_cov_7.210607_6_plen_163_part_00